MSAGSVAFRHAVDERWAVPVKNTFISFDNPLALPTACLRSSTCPPLYRLGGFLTQDDITWESATQELCHCMAPRRPSRGRAPLAPVAVEQCSTVAASSDNAQAVESSETSAPLSPVACDAMASKSNTRELVEGPKEVVSACSKGKGAPDREGEADAMSEVSTKESEGSLERGKSSTVQQWTSVLSKSKKSKGAGCVESRGKHGDTSPPANGRASRARGEQQGSGRGAQAVDAPQSPTAAAPVTPKGYGKGKGKGKGLPYFHRIEVGIPDDPQFRVVQKLIGPKGKHMQDILSEAPGAKVWIIGRGSRSWEDDSGPLMICVGAPTSSVFETAVRLSEGLLERVREEHRQFF
mmetsp:Transcript_119937/g.208289  ORF Transcript_119937/g.208289 Transcript_119937/m.208289 type:complete len:351 (-) Transcript_119937:27-1079(-)